MTVVVVVLTARGQMLATSIARSIEGAEIHGLQDRVSEVDAFFEDTITHLHKLYQSGHSIIGVCAAGILIRALGSVLDNKTEEPPVIAVSEDGNSVVPLLGGHNGANRLAVSIAEVCDGHAAITTAGDVRFGIALDDPPVGWGMSNTGAAKKIMTAMLAGEPVNIDLQSGDPEWLLGSDIPTDDNAEQTIIVSHRTSENQFTLHPPVLTVGVGCERNTGSEELIELVEKALFDNQLARGSIACIASIDVKMDEDAVHAAAEYFDVPARFYTADELETMSPRLANPSDIVFSEVGCHGVSEGAALMASGKSGDLIVPKVKSQRATVAIGLSKTNVDASTRGKQRGRLSVVGIGPGKSDWRTPAVTKAVSQASDVVGYKLYLELLGDLINGKQSHMSELAQEEERVRKALDLAAEGRNVALVCSGDAGIYALATLVFELIDLNDRPDWNRLRIDVEPGVSAIQAAASKIGAPIGHDFCTISLSDLLTPWTEIERRLKAAAAGDFVVAFYNPVSKRRRHQLEIARDTLLAERSAETPVMLARNLGRTDESISYITLGELTPDHADMLTLVMVGNSQSKMINIGGTNRVYTPRGYADKNS
jgi:cobalt-precorrin 5A hydrolase/precorrin-3B C17-methyltransferase